MVDVVHLCHPGNHTRASGHCGLHHRPTSLVCRGCGYDLNLPGHEAH